MSGSSPIQTNFTGIIMRRALIVRVAVAGLLGMLTTGIALAQNNYSNAFVGISNLVFYSTADDIYPLYAGATVVNLATPVTWTFNGPCATGAVAIRPGDKALITAVETAEATGRPIQVFVDDSQTVDGVVCWLRAVEM
jgi:hypothetical protein